MRDYVVKDAGVNRQGKHICRIWTCRDVARELYEILLDSKEDLSIEALSRLEDKHIELVLTPLADDSTITNIRHVVSIVQAQVDAKTESRIQDGLYSQPVKDIFSRQGGQDLKQLSAGTDVPETVEKPEETADKEKVDSAKEGPVEEKQE